MAMHAMSGFHFTVRLHGTIVGPTGRPEATYDWSVRPVGPTGRTDCSRTAHICKSNQCGLLADYKPPLKNGGQFRVYDSCSYVAMT